VGKYAGSRQATDERKIWLMSFAGWIPKAAGTHSEYSIHIAFPLQQWFRERALMLRLCGYCLSYVYWTVHQLDG